MADNPIVLKHAFKPRAEAMLLSRIVQDAWKAENDKLAAMAYTYNVGAKAWLVLVQLYPPLDMEVLARYGHACETEHVRVAVQNPVTNRYEDVQVTLPVKVWVPGTGGYSDARLNAGGPYYNESNCWGCKPDAWAAMPEKEQDDIRKYWQASARRALPDSTDPFFHAIIAARNNFQTEYKRVTQWPEASKFVTGRWPTWGEIAEQFPAVTGAAILKLAAEG